MINKIQINYGISTRPLTRTWNPNLAFKYRATAEHKRRVNTFRKFQNYKERMGWPIQFWSDPLATAEIHWLRGELQTVLGRSWDFLEMAIADAD